MQVCSAGSGHPTNEPQLFATGHASSQPFLHSLEEVEWRAVQRLFDREGEASVG